LTDIGFWLVFPDWNFWIFLGIGYD